MAARSQRTHTHIPHIQHIQRYTFVSTISFDNVAQTKRHDTQAKYKKKTKKQTKPTKTPEKEKTFHVAARMTDRPIYFPCANGIKLQQNLQFRNENNNKKSATCLHFSLYIENRIMRKSATMPVCVCVCFFIRFFFISSENERHRMDFITFEHLTFKMVWIRLSCFHFASMDFHSVRNEH